MSMDREQELSFAKVCLAGLRLKATVFLEQATTQLQWVNDGETVMATAFVQDKEEPSADVQIIFPREISFGGFEGFNLCKLFRDIDVTIVEPPAAETPPQPADVN